MTHRGWLLGVLMLLLSASFAGCLGGDDDPEPADSDDSKDTMSKDGDAGSGNETASSDDSGTDSEGDVATAAPEAAIELIGNETLATGESFTVDASGTTDADTDAANLTFSWDFGDGNTSEGINATHSFAEAGNFTIMLNVTDPEGNFGVANITLVVEEAAQFEEGLVTAVSGTITAPNPVVGELVLAYPSLSAACSTVLACFETFGGVEGTHWEKHVISDLPEGAGSFRFEDTGAGTFPVDFAIFDMDGAKLSGNTIGPNTANGARFHVLSNPTVTEVQVFVFLHAGASAAYNIDVTAFAPEE